MQHSQITPAASAAPVAVTVANPGKEQKPAPAPCPPASALLHARLAVCLSRLADALSTACTGELELIGMPAFDPAVADWLEEAEAGWRGAWASAEALATGPGDGTAARWCRRLGRAVIDVLDADRPSLASIAFRRIDALLEDLPEALRSHEARTVARLRCCLSTLFALCDALDRRVQDRAVDLQSGVSPG